MNKQKWPLARWTRRGKVSLAMMIGRPQSRHRQRLCPFEFTHSFCHKPKARGVKNPVSRIRGLGLADRLPIGGAASGPGFFERLASTSGLASLTIQSLFPHYFLFLQMALFRPGASIFPPVIPFILTPVLALPEL